eukprot:scaffold31971_cov46-Attheya_sp.AAC.2
MSNQQQQQQHGWQPQQQQPGAYYGGNHGAPPPPPPPPPQQHLGALCPPPPPPPPPPYGYNYSNQHPPSTLQQHQPNGWHPQQQQQQTYHNYYQPYGSSIVPPPPPPPPPPPAYPTGHEDNHNNKRKWPSSVLLHGKKNRVDDVKKNDSGEPPPQGSSCEEKKISSSSFVCEDCGGLELASEQALDAHVEAHVTCRAPKCPYRASPKLVNAHYSKTHGKFSGKGLQTIRISVPGSRHVQTFKICVGNHPDDIDLWIAERKKNFPTVQKKREQREQQQQQQLSHTNKASPHNRGISRQTETSQPAVTNKNDTNKEKKEEGGALSSLMAGYASSSDSDNEHEKQKESTEENGLPAKNKDGLHTENETMVPKQGEEDTKTTTIHQNNSNNYRTRVCRFFMRTGTCKNGENCTYLHSDDARQQRRTQQSDRDKARPPQHRHAPTTKPTLLKKLLEKDAKRETSLTLQLLRYIVDCNYLQEQKRQTTPLLEAVEPNTHTDFP